MGKRQATILQPSSEHQQILLPILIMISSNDFEVIWWHFVSRYF